MSFNIDPRIATTCTELTNWSLSSVLLKNNADYPWLILVPRLNDIQEIDQLSISLQHQLMEEISRLSSIVRRYFKPDKLNIGALGNIVSQLHIHIIARYKNDKLWPHGIWQEQQQQSAYAKEELLAIIHDLRHLLNE